MTFHLIHLKNTSIYEQLRLEEELLRQDTRNFCLINEGTPPAIVMGISGKASELINYEKLSVPVIRRFSGGGTVIVDESTLFVTFICNQHAYPETILRWAESIFAPVTPGLSLRENDFVFGEKKCGGNALYIKKDRWIIHTSFLWDYNPSHMEMLKHPMKTPTYRAGRSHTDFLLPLSEKISDKNGWLVSLKNEIDSRFGLEHQVSLNHTPLSSFGTTVVELAASLPQQD